VKIKSRKVYERKLIISSSAQTLTNPTLARYTLRLESHYKFSLSPERDKGKLLN
jgi:hypothetical protein